MRTITAVPPTDEEQESLSWAVARYEAVQAFRMATDNRAREMLSMFDLYEPDMLAAFHKLETAEKRTMAALVQKHPMYGWLTSFCGIDDTLAARLIGNLPDLWNFSGVAKLWAFFHMDGDEWRELVTPTKKGGKNRYRGSPQLRSLCWNMGKLFKQYGKEGAAKDPRFGLVYQERLLYEASKTGCGQLLRRKSGKKEVYSDCTQGHCSELHQDRKAKVYAEKEFLKAFWTQWRQVMPKQPGTV